MYAFQLMLKSAMLRLQNCIKVQCVRINNMYNALFFNDFYKKHIVLPTILNCWVE